MKNNDAIKNILLTGASGFVGSVLVKSLIQHNYNVAILSRNSAASGGSSSGNCKIFSIDSSRSDFGLMSAMHNIDTIIHLAARVHVMHDSDPDPLNAFRKANVEYTKQLAELAVASKVKRFIFISSLHVMGSTSLFHPLNEEDQPKPPSPYAISKWEAELYLNDLAQKTNMEIIVIRSPLVYGPGVKANFLSLLNLAKRGLPLPVGLLNNKRSMVSVNNLVDFIICCIKSPYAANETFLISDDCDISTKELFAKLIKLFGKTPLLLPIPPKILLFLGSMLGKKDIVDRLCSPLQVDITKAKTRLNWKPIQKLDDGLKETVEWYKRECL